MGSAPALRRARACLVAVTLAVAALAEPASGAPALRAFNFATVADRARELAAQPYAAPTAKLPQALATLSYDAYRDIRFDPHHAWWREQGLPFELMFFHLGKFQTLPVVLHEVVDGRVYPIAFDAGAFDYGRNQLAPETWGDLGYAGFRLHTFLNTSAYQDELAVFLGASYFRALGRGQTYGLSARGLAIDTAGPGPEEFPRFVEFWIERPALAASQVIVHALLDSPRATGAYLFAIAPGDATVVEIQARVYLRAPGTASQPLTSLGLAPLTSMFHHGENQPQADDFRPEVHDSDGLLIATGDGAAGEWLWRPLINPAQTLVTSFAMQRLRGFGLMQRDRDYADYQDAEAHYERRPSAWVEPSGDWGPGRVELVQLTTPDETNDNIVAYWVPASLPAPGTPLDFAYRLHWQGDRQTRPPMGWTVQSRRGHGFRDPLAPVAAREVQFVVDFDGPALRALAPDSAVQAVVSASPNAQVVERNAYCNPATGTWRMTLRIDRLDSPQPVELRAQLQSHDLTLTETWTSILPND